MKEEKRNVRVMLVTGSSYTGTVVEDDGNKLRLRLRNYKGQPTKKFRSFSWNSIVYVDEL